MYVVGRLLILQTITDYSTPVLMNGGLICFAVCLFVCDWTMIHDWTKIYISGIYNNFYELI